MPSYRCRHPTCGAYLKTPGYCSAHASTALNRHADYDQRRRDRDLKQFYDSAAWRAVRAARLANQPWCSNCHRPANTVHHVKPAKDFPDLRLDPANLDCLCASCHSQLEARQVSPDPNNHGHDRRP